jgi:hypothetical protein
MSKEKSKSPDSSETAPVHTAGSRRTAKSRSGKPAKSAKAGDSAPEEPTVEKSPHPYPVFDLAESGSSTDSIDTAEISPQEKTKRKRRRKKGKGGGSQNAAQSTFAETSPEPEEEAPAKPAATPRQPDRQPRLKLDPESVAKLALKIYLAEVSEEGVALIGDSDAKELSRRCFRLAEIFMEEQARRG